MFCPSCGAEYKPEVSACATCDVPLVAELPGEPEHPDVELVEVFRTTNAAVLPIVKSLLDSAGIEHFVQGEEAIGLLPVGPMGAIVSRATLAAMVHVKKEDAESVKEVLAELTRDESTEDEPSDDGPTTE